MTNGELSLFFSRRSPYYIFAADYRNTSAGIRCLHYLCHALNELGLEAYLVNAKVVSNYLRTPRLTKEIVSAHFKTGRVPIAVYPEVASGNPLRAPVVTRWLLNKPGHLGGDTVYEKSDLIFYYNAWCLPEGMSGSELYIQSVDSRIFNNFDNPYDQERSGACFYAHKYLAFGGQVLPEHADFTSLCHDIPRSPEEIAAILRRSEALYCYEPSAIIAEALVCGCPVLIVPTDYWRPGADDLHLHEEGVALASEPDALVKAKASFGTVATRILAKEQMSWEQIRSFIEQTQARARRLREGENSLAPSFVEGFLDVTSVGLPYYAKLALADRLKSQPTVSYADVNYALWQKTHDAYESGFELLDRWIDNLGDRPVFHWVVTLPDDRLAELSNTLQSIVEQRYPHWVVTVVARMPAPEGFANIKELRWQTVPAAGFVEAFNRVALEDEFDWFGVLAAGDRLAPHALQVLADQVTRHPEWAVVYADEDNLNEIGDRERPYFKTDFSIDSVRAAPYCLGGGVAFRHDLLRRLSGMDIGFVGAEFFDLTLRAYEQLGARGFGHVSDVICHRSAGANYSEHSPEEIVGLRRKVLEGHLARQDHKADIDNGVLPGTFRIRYRISDGETVSIIIPTQNGGTSLQRCVSALIENTDYKNWELIVVDQDSDDPDTLTFLDFLRGMNNDAVTVLTQPRGLSVPALLNTGAAQACGQYVLFHSDAGAPLRGDWLEEMLGYAVQPGVGVVGPKMVGQDSNISSAGYILGLEGRPAGLHDLHARPDDLGYFGQLQVPNNPSAVMWTCMLTSKALFDELGGFDAENLPDAYSDVDYCLKSWRAGRRVVWTPYALVLHEHLTDPEEEVDDGDVIVDERRPWHTPIPAAHVMFERWLDRIAFDPAYNRNLSLNRGAFKIETSPALTWDPEWRPVPRVLAHTADQGGCGEYRVIAPMRALAAQGKIQGWNTNYYLSIPELARVSPDSLILQRQVYPRQITFLEDYIPYSKAFRVYELDDLLTNIQTSNQARQAYAAKDLVKRFRHVLDLCDRFVVSTAFLAEEYRKFKSDIVVVPNTMERAKWGHLQPRRRTGRKARVGWAGGSMHSADLALIADVVRALADEVEWVFFGLCPEGVRHLVEYHASVPVDLYPAKLASMNLDLALAPLEDVPFNHAKSHLRLLEYGILGYPVICTDITPYRGDYPVTRVRNRFKDWVEAIREHLSDLDELARRGDALRDHVNARWILEDHLDDWLKAWLP